MDTVCRCGISVSSPSMADEMVIGGVMIPSANKAHPPITAGTMSHFALRRTNENNENMPPSPLLSARRVITTYFRVVCSVSVQKIQETPPNINASVICWEPTIALNTYSGEVPISP